MDRQDRPKKYLTQVINVVESILQSTSAVIRMCNGVKCSHSVVLRRGQVKGFETILNTDLRFPFNSIEPWSLEMDIAGHLVTTKHAYEQAHSVSFTQQKHEVSVSFKLRDFHTIGSHVAPSFWRVIIPLPDNIFRLRHFQLDQDWYSPEITSICGRVTVILENCHVDVLFHKENERQFLIYDILSAMVLNEAQECVHDIGLTLGYVTGVFAQNECFCFSYPTVEMTGVASEFSFRELRDSIHSHYAPICSNPYTFLYAEKEDAERLFPLLRTLSISEFSKLCQRVLTDDHFAAHLLLIMEAMGASVVSMPPGLCVALEGIVKAPSTLKVAVEVDAKVKNYIDLLTPIVQKELVSLKNPTNEGLCSAISGRLRNLTQPTNRALLEAPFIAMNYSLSPEDIKAINSRNRFLHGDVLLGNKDGVDQAGKDAYYMALRLYALLAVLILKPTGYNNYIVNYAKLRVNVHNKPVLEDFYLNLDQSAT